MDGKTYLSDGAYVELRGSDSFRGNGIEVVLTAENGLRATDRIVLDLTGLIFLTQYLRHNLPPEVWKRMVSL